MTEFESKIVAKGGIEGSVIEPVPNIVFTESMTITTPPAQYGALHFEITKSGNIKLPVPILGQAFTIVLEQNSTGGYVVKLEAPEGVHIRWSEGKPQPTWNIIALAADVIAFVCVKANEWSAIQVAVAMK